MNSESEHYFCAGQGADRWFLKCNWGQAQTEQELEDSFEIQRVMYLPPSGTRQAKCLNL